MGFVRIGIYFVIEYFDVVFDLIMVFKLFVVGLLLSGVIGCVEMFDVVVSGELGGMYVGSLFGCVVVLVVLDIIEEEGLNECFEKIGKMIENKVYEWK